APALGRGLRPDDGDGHARPAGGDDRRPHSLPRRWSRRQGASRLERPRSARRRRGAERTMIAVALRGLAGRKLRSALTALAIVLGVAMVSGTFVLTDTIKKGFDSISAASYKHTDVTISGKSAFASDAGDSSSPGFPASLLAKVRTLPDVAAASGSVEGEAKLIDRNGKTIRGAPNAISVEPGRDQRFNPLTLVRGAWPSGPREIAIDESTANAKGFAVGDTIAVSSRQP